MYTEKTEYHHRTEDDLAIHGYIFLDDIKTGDRQFKSYGEVSEERIIIISFGNDGKLHSKGDDGNLYEEYQRHFLFDPNRLEIVRLDGTKLDGIKPQVEKN